MTKNELIDAVAGRTGTSRQIAADYVDAVLDVITDTVAGGEKVALIGFGAWERVQRPERQARNPQTGQTITVPATNVPKFKAGTDFKGAVAGRQAA